MPNKKNVVELVHCHKRVSATGQDCIDPNCRTCKGAGKYWRQIPRFSNEMFANTQTSMMMNVDFASFLDDVLNDVLGSNMFDHGCGGSPYPCQICDREHGPNLLSKLIDLRAQTLRQHFTQQNNDLIDLEGEEQILEL